MSVRAQVFPLVPETSELANLPSFPVEYVAIFRDRLARAIPRDRSRRYGHYAEQIGKASEGRGGDGTVSRGAFQFLFSKPRRKTIILIGLLLGPAPLQLEIFVNNNWQGGGLRRRRLLSWHQHCKSIQLGIIHEAPSICEAHTALYSLSPSPTPRSGSFFPTSHSSAAISSPAAHPQPLKASAQIQKL